METKTSAKGMENMKLIGVAIVVIIVIAAGALLLMGGKGSASKSTATIPATTTAATSASGSGSSSSGTSGSSSGSGSSAGAGASNTSTSSSGGSLSSMLSGWTGKNLSISQFSKDLGGVAHSVQSQYNVTYDYKTHVSSSGQYAYSENVTGTTMVERYYNDSRITTNSNTTYGAATVIAIYNATAQKEYVCSSSAETGSSFECIATATNVTAENSSGLGYISSLNSTTKGYFSNIKVSSSSYNGQACTLVSGDMYLSTVVDNSTSTTNGQMSMCLSTSLGVLLTQSMNATTSIQISGKATTSNIDYTMDEVSIGKSTTAAITVLPGPVTTI